MSTNQTPLILSIETATRAGSVAVTRGDIVLAESVGDAAISHSSLLLNYVSDVLEGAGVRLEDIMYFAVATGPGSFTGLRIGLATIKSFAATLGRPCIGVPTLFAVAHAAGESGRTLALLPAGRGEVYAQLLRVGQGGEIHPLESPAHLTPQKLLEKARTETSLTWAGEGAQLHLEAIRSQALAEGILLLDESRDGQAKNRSERQWMIAPTQPVLAISVARLALLRIHSADVETPEQLHAIYVRPSDAELKEDFQEER